MNPIRQLWHLIRNDNVTPTIAKARVVQNEAVVQQAATSRLIRSRIENPGPLLGYVWGEGKRND